MIAPIVLDIQVFERNTTIFKGGLTTDILQSIVIRELSKGHLQRPVVFALNAEQLFQVEARPLFRSGMSTFASEIRKLVREKLIEAVAYSVVWRDKTYGRMTLVISQMSGEQPIGFGITSFEPDESGTLHAQGAYVHTLDFSPPDLFAHEPEEKEEKTAGPLLYGADGRPV